MTAPYLVRALLLNDATTRAALGVAPESVVVVGALPLNTSLPAIAVSEISSNDRKTVAKGARVKVTSRVQLTVAGADVPSRNTLMRAVRPALRAFVGDVALPSGETHAGVTAHLAGKGPEFEVPGGAFVCQTQDVIVTYDENA